MAQSYRQIVLHRLLLALAISPLLCVARPPSALGRRLAQAPAGAPAAAPSSAFLANLTAALTGNASASGPVLYKTAEAALYAQLALDNSTAGLPQGDQARVVSLGNGSQALVVWQASNRTAVIAFAASNATTTNMTAGVNLQSLTFLSDLFRGSPPRVNAPVLQPFLAVLDTLHDLIDVTLSGGQDSPVRITCTGAGGGGAWAQLCGVWAATHYTDANIRMISWGAPRVGDQAFYWALEQFVDNPQAWSIPAADASVTGQPAGLPAFNLTRVYNASATNSSGDGGSLQQYITALNATIGGAKGLVPLPANVSFSYGFLPSERTADSAPANSPGGADVGSIRNFVGNVRDSVVAAASTAGVLLRDVFGGGGSSAPAPAPSSLGALGTAGPTPGGSPGSPQSTGGTQATGSGHAGCEVVLCKLDPAVIDACAAYDSGNGTIAPNSIFIEEPKFDTSLHVAWNDTDRVATFDFRGSTTRQDWIQDFKLWTTTAPMTSFFDNLYPGTELHAGFVQQFRAVTDQAAAPQYNMSAALDRLRGGVAPLRVLCTGHSLGAGVSTLCAVWAANRWPAADVRHVSFGSPKVGNIAFAQAFQAYVGRSYRVVNAFDEVPALAPITAYVHVNYGIWLRNGSVLLEDRPATSIGHLSWNDHGCDDHYEPGVLEAGNVTVPAPVVQRTAFDPNQGSPTAV